MRLQRLVWVYTCQNTTLLETSCPGSDLSYNFRVLGYVRDSYFPLCVHGYLVDPELYARREWWWNSILHNTWLHQDARYAGKLEAPVFEICNQVRVKPPKSSQKFAQQVHDVEITTYRRRRRRRYDVVLTACTCRRCFDVMYLLGEKMHLSCKANVLFRQWKTTVLIRL